MDEEKRRAAILAIDVASGRERLYASGLRNPVGMDFAPTTGTLWTAVNERDHFGDDIAPDYLVGVREGGFTAGRTAIMASRILAMPMNGVTCWQRP